MNAEFKEEEGLAIITEEREEIADYNLKNYTLSYSPNDFNVDTIFGFIEKGVFKIPNFQRNYVWDIKRASKLIESLILGLPIPQIFLFEQSKNNFLVIDGQQRLMSIYYFKKRRFPRADKKMEIRRIFADKGNISDEVLQDDKYFSSFILKLPQNGQAEDSSLEGLDYESLGTEQMTLDLTPIRSLIIKPNSQYDSFAIYEIFNRLNSGGINLKPQEIRNSLFHSPFLDMLHQINLNTDWRNLIKKEEVDLHMKDVEFLLRAFAMLLEGENYSSSMLKFLDNFSEKTRSFEKSKVEYLRSLFKKFIEEAKKIGNDIFVMKDSKKVSIAYIESIFKAVCLEAVKNNDLNILEIEKSKIEELKNNEEFRQTTSKSSTSRENVSRRLAIAQTILTN